jgi:hypothetical protein
LIVRAASKAEYVERWTPVENRGSMKHAASPMRTGPGFQNDVLRYDRSFRTRYSP